MTTMDIALAIYLSGFIVIMATCLVAILHDWWYGYLEIRGGDIFQAIGLSLCSWLLILYVALVFVSNFIVEVSISAKDAVILKRRIKENK